MLNRYDVDFSNYSFDEQEKLNELKVAISNGKRVNLQGAKFIKVDLTNIDLSHMNLTEVVFDKAIINNLNLSETNLQSASFIRVDPSTVNFEGSIVEDATFSELENLLPDNFIQIVSKNELEQPNLFKVNFFDLNLDRQDFTNAYIEGSSYEMCELPQGFFQVVANKDLRGVNLNGVPVNNEKFEDVKLAESILGDPDGHSPPILPNYDWVSVIASDENGNPDLCWVEFC